MLSVSLGFLALHLNGTGEHCEHCTCFTFGLVSLPFYRLSAVHFTKVHTKALERLKGDTRWETKVIGNPKL